MFLEQYLHQEATEEDANSFLYHIKQSNAARLPGDDDEDLDQLDMTMTIEDQMINGIMTRQVKN